MSRILRSLVCLLLICCILVNLSPLKAKAVTPGMVAVGTVSALVLIPAILYGLGVMQSSTDTGSAAFNQLVSDCNDHLTNLGWIAAGAATMLSLTQDGSVITYAHRNMIQDIFDWLFDSGTAVPASVAYGQYISVGEWYNGFQYSVPVRAYKVFGLKDPTVSRTEYHSFHGVVAVDPNVSFNQKITNSNGSITAYPSTNSICYVDGLMHYLISFSGGTGAVSLSDLSSTFDDTWTQVTYSDTVGGLISGLSTTQDISLGYIAEQDTDIETGYETYIQEGIVSIDFGIGFEEGSPYDPDGDDQKYHHWFPVKVPSPDNLSNLTQEDAWSGESEVELEYKTDTDTGTDSGNGSGNGSGNTGTDSGSTGNTGSSWKPPSSHSQFKLVDLSKFFPFCIPFDLFDFFKLLNADPVAPSFTWEIQDLSGQTYGLTVDLSQWDSVAQLFRRLQLFLFVCGLAAASRKYIKW